MVAGPMDGRADGRVADGDAQFVMALLDGDAYRTALRRRLDAVIDGVLQQRLQHQRRNGQIHRDLAGGPFDLQAFAQAQAFEIEILFAQGDFIGQTDQFARVAHGGAEQFSQRLQCGFGLLRPGANQREHGVQRIEQEVRPDAGIERGQPGFGLGWRKGAGAQFEIDQQDQRGGQGQQDDASQALVFAERQRLAVIIERDDQRATEQQHAALGKAQGQAPQQVAGEREQAEGDQQQRLDDGGQVDETG